MLAKKAASTADAESFAARDDIPQRYRNVYRAYRAKKDAPLADRRVSALMREKTLDALKISGMTNYRLCKDLGLNMGNVYAYLGKNDTTKVSRATARRIMEYATMRAEETRTNRPSSAMS